MTFNVAEFHVNCAWGHEFFAMFWLRHPFRFISICPTYLFLIYKVPKPYNPDNEDKCLLDRNICHLHPSFLFSTSSCITIEVLPWISHCLPIHRFFFKRLELKVGRMCARVRERDRERERKRRGADREKHKIPERTVLLETFVWSLSPLRSQRVTASWGFFVFLSQEEIW